MKIIVATIAVGLALWPASHAFGEEAPPGCCAGGYHPAKNCKTCERCWYCGTKPGRYKGARPENTGKCMVCAPDLFPPIKKKGTP